MPPGPAVAVLPSDDAPWPVAQDRRQRNVGGQFKGYRLDAQRQPIFMYRLGDIAIEEQPLPVPREGGVALARKFHLMGAPPDAGKLWLLAAAGAKVEQQSPGVWKVDDKLTVRVAAPQGAKEIVRDGALGKQLLVPLDLKGGGASVEIDMAW
jgi:hypothetical protein